MVGYHLWFLQLVVKLCFVQVLWTGSGERHWMQQFHSSIPGSRKSQEIPAPLLDAACDLFHCRTQRWACVSLPLLSFRAASQPFNPSLLFQSNRLWLFLSSSCWTDTEPDGKKSSALFLLAFRAQKSRAAEAFLHVLPCSSLVSRCQAAGKSEGSEKTVFV